jgi:hypothetical protein
MIVSRWMDEFACGGDGGYGQCECAFTQFPVKLRLNTIDGFFKYMYTVSSLSSPLF